MLIIFAIILGLALNYYTGGLKFYSALCFGAGLFMIMPYLFKLNTNIFKGIFNKYFFVNIFLNFFVVPAIFWGIGYMTNDISILFAMVLLAFMSGGGLLFAWLGKTNSNMSLGFQLFFVNIFVFTFLFIAINLYLNKTGFYTTVLYKNIENTGLLGCNMNIGNLSVCGLEQKQSVSPIGGLVALVIVPFFVSRVVRLSAKFTSLLSKHIKTISSFATFFIIFYIFSLKQLHNIFLIDLNMIFKILFPVFMAYFITFSLNYFICKYLGVNTDTKALFWLGSTRFITMGIVFSFIYTQYFGINFLLVFVCAYFVQIFFSLIFSKILR